MDAGPGSRLLSFALHRGLDPAAAGFDPALACADVGPALLISRPDEPSARANVSRVISGPFVIAQWALEAGLLINGTASEESGGGGGEMIVSIDISLWVPAALSRARALSRYISPCLCPLRGIKFELAPAAACAPVPCLHAFCLPPPSQEHGGYTGRDMASGSGAHGRHGAGAAGRAEGGTCACISLSTPQSCTAAIHCRLYAAAASSLP